MSGPATVGWCPGALRPMESGDGLILRVKPRGGRLTLDQAEAIARLSLRYGNGHLDLTGRANLQIRGARPDTLNALTDGLREAGLLDANAAVESLRNIVASPLAGIDPDCFDTRPFLAELERCIAEIALRPPAPPPSLRGGAAAAAIQPGAGDLDCFAPLAMTGERPASLQAFPAKWSFNVDGGGRLPLDAIPADMRFRFDGSGTLCLGLGETWSDPLPALDLCKLLLDAAALVATQPEPLRMQGLLARLGSGAVFAHLGLRVARMPEPETARVSRTALFAARNEVVVLAPPFGSLPATDLAQLVAACRTFGGSDLRLTPWRVLLATGIADRAKLLAHLSHLDFIQDAADPRLDVSACVGAPACHRATTPTRADAAWLAGELGRDLDGPVHIAGCAKGCGRPSETAWTMLGHEGQYNLFHAGDLDPSVTGLSSVEAANWLSRAGRARIS